MLGIRDVKTNARPKMNDELVHADVGVTIYGAKVQRVFRINAQLDPF